ncbi:MAG: sugar phosphorylase [Calditrichaceae bacterium]|nr:sugar phosphorylase [Calditrichaceae bacterium]
MFKSFDPSKFYYLKPDYTQPVLDIPGAARNNILSRLEQLYDKALAVKWLPEIERVMKVHYAHKTPEMHQWEQHFQHDNRFTEKDIILITYGDIIRNHGDKPLHTIKEICHKYLHDAFNTIHILPFFPYSSDRGFAVLDFEEVDPNLGTWNDILDLKSEFKLMFDGVLNHVSSKSRWFQEFLNQNPDFVDFFTVFSTKESISPDHLKLIVRPRTTDVLNSFDTLNGRRMVWTTFSSDQIDLNYRNPKVLIKMVEILLMYIRRGADIIRLDAVTYLWEQLGTTCAHLEQNHITIKLFRDILNVVAPHVALITETNVPHQDNIKYFGNGLDEAQMVYNFALPPLVLHTFQTGNASVLTRWAESLHTISNQAAYFNFLDSHDGIGVMAVKGILTDKEVELMALKVLEHGGYISYKDNGDGTKSPYELNITWYSAINNEDADEPQQLQIKRYIASRSIALVMMGVPGIYFHGLLGSKNDAELVIIEKETRSINRKNISQDELIKALETPDTTTSMVTKMILDLIKIRIHEPAFHPNSKQRVLNLSDKAFCLMRAAVDQNSAVLAIVNIVNESLEIAIEKELVSSYCNETSDLIAGKLYTFEKDKIIFNLEPYQVIWLKFTS